VLTDGIVNEMEVALASVEKEVFIAECMSVETVLGRELEVAGAKESVVVVVSGPPGMADDVRVAVTRLGRDRGVRLTLVGRVLVGNMVNYEAHHSSNGPR